MSDLKLGFVGLGSMGIGMARNAMAAGLEAKGYDISPAVREAFAESGGTPVDSAAEAATDVDVLVLMVVNGAQVREVMFGENGAAAALRPGSVVMICCTIAPKDAREIAQQLTDAGLLVIDTPVSGGKVGADAGTLTLMASGPEAAFEVAQPVIDAVSGTLYRVGEEPGLGATYKVVHQLAAGTHLAVAAEVMALGAHAGCDTAILADIVSKSAGQSWMFNDRVPRMLDREFGPRGAVDIFVKDLGLVIETGYATKTPLPLAAAAQQIFLAASSMGHGKEDDAAVVKFYEAATGSSVKRRVR